ncbi:MAG: magnesium chelatase, partial [Acidobacteriota bacterium]|nr:magnesium chelatase [Acidobacteriota bacterium]
MKRPETLGELKATGYRPRGVKDELRGNLRKALAEGRNPFEGIHGYERTVLPALHNAILSRH